MKKSIQEIMQWIKEEDIKMVDFKMVDINGQFRHVTIPAGCFSEETMKSGIGAEIGIDAFAQVELRVAEILECEPIPKAKKLLKLQVDLGYEKRQVVSGIAKYYTPDELVGKKVVLVTNLKPAKLCGVDSYGMILASGEDDVKVVFLDPSVRNGERIH